MSLHGLSEAFRLGFSGHCTCQPGIVSLAQRAALDVRETRGQRRQAGPGFLPELRFVAVCLRRRQPDTLWAPNGVPGRTSGTRAPAADLVPLSHDMDRRSFGNRKIPDYALMDFGAVAYSKATAPVLRFEHDALKVIHGTFPPLSE